MPGDQLDFVDNNGNVRIAGSLVDEGATPGDVLTVNADGSISAAAGGGTFSHTVAIHVPDETTPVLNLYNDTWDTDPADPVLQVFAENNGDAFIAALSDAKTLILGLSGEGIKLKNGTGIGFFDASAVGQPVVPLTTPSVQNVIDALVALGLVAQHD